MKKYIVLFLMLPSFVMAEENANTLILDKSLGVHSKQADLNASNIKPSLNLPKPDLIFEHNLSYTPTTRIRHRIISGGTNLPQFRAIPESEYYRGN